MTLIEVLIVITIIGMLAAMAMPMVGVARRQSAVTSTSSVLEKINNAMLFFKRDVGAFPYFDHRDKPFDDSAAGCESAERLVYCLAYSKSKDALVESRVKRNKLKEWGENAQGDVDKAYRAYRPGGDHYITGDRIAIVSLGSTEWEDPREDRQESFNDNRPVYAALVNRLAWERAVVAVMSGQVQVKGIGGSGFSEYDKRGQTVVNSPGSWGFGDDYLTNDIDPQLALAPAASGGFMLVDHWKKPLIYICPVTPGVSGGRPNSSLWRVDGPIVTTVKSERFGLTPQGREETTDKNSDCRTHAHKTSVFMYELMSRGPDGLANPIRTESDNDDNLHATSGWRLLQ
ncbi:MAG: type II secretion system GspH family protein [Planctomycetes bacterium]|nr:type II secretion system GspH family protein [Planctomycetota bacterium]